ncbi:MAG TPA: hypothetical protein VHU91_06975, partial [Mycobacteriales bacterium]|nr:hypothetical protein [Mycobacteriales bacterium]
MSDVDTPDPPPPPRYWFLPDGPRDWFRQGVALLEHEAGSEPAGIAIIVAWAAVIVVGSCRLLHTLTIGARPAIAWAGVVAVCLVALGCLVLLGTVFWRTRVSTESRGAYALALIGSVLVLAVGIEAFAGITALLWREDAIAVQSGAHPTLWRAELAYMWQLTDSIPLLSIPKTLSWQDPLPLSDTAGGAVLLTFKILIIGPLIRLAIGGYQFIENYAATERATRHQLHQRAPGKDPKKLAKYVDAWWWCRSAAAWTLISFVAFVLLSDPDSFVIRWVADRTQHDFGL